MDNSQQQIKFSKEFTAEIDTYIAIYKKSQKIPTVAGFANRIGTDEQSIYAWANKQKKDEQGNVTSELARPNFNAAVKRLEEASKELEQKKEEEREKLNPKQEMFCQLYARSNEFFGNATQCYLVAYEIDKNNEKEYKYANMAASRLMVNDSIVRRISELLQGVTDEMIDEELIYVALQRNELPSKVAAIREYNKVKARVTDKLDITSKGKQIKQVVGFTVLPPSQNDGTDKSDNQANA